MRVSENSPVRGRGHVVLSHEGLASGNKLMEFIVIDPGMPAPLNFELYVQKRG
jgi:hypothetical protein